MGDLVHRAHVRKTAQIRELNDTFRRTFTGGNVVLTVGVSELLQPQRTAVIQAVRTFADDAFEIEGQTYFAKIDYYDPSLSGGSEDPADPEKTTRVLTIMRADEY